MSFKDYIEATVRELEQWPGASFTYAYAGKHCAVTLSFEGRTREVIMPVSPSDWRGPRAHITTVRHELKRLGAQRHQRAPTRRRERRRASPRRKVRVTELAPVLSDPFADLRKLWEKHL